MKLQGMHRDGVKHVSTVAFISFIFKLNLPSKWQQHAVPQAWAF